MSRDDRGVSSLDRRVTNRARRQVKRQSWILGLQIHVRPEYKKCASLVRKRTTGAFDDGSVEPCFVARAEAEGSLRLAHRPVASLLRKPPWKTFNGSDYDRAGSLLAFDAKVFCAGEPTSQQSLRLLLELGDLVITRK